MLNILVKDYLVPYVILNNATYANIDICVYFQLQTLYHVLFADIAKDELSLIWYV